MHSSHPPSAVSHPGVDVPSTAHAIDAVAAAGSPHASILLMHGLGGTPAELQPLTHQLRRFGCTVETILLPGHGGTPADLARTQVDDWRQACLAAHDRLIARGTAVFVGGLSMGALLALDLASLRPDQVHGLVLLAPTLRLDGWSMPYPARYAGHLRACWVPAALALAERAPHGLKDPRVRALVTERMRAGDARSAGLLRTPLRALAELGALAADVHGRLGGIRQPTLLMHPRADDVADIAGAFRVARALGGPVELHVLDDSYHLVTLDRQRSKVAATVSRFVRALAQPAPSRPDREAVGDATPGAAPALH